jgi:Domain of Unknown Function (DUF1080)
MRFAIPLLSLIVCLHGSANAQEPIDLFADGLTAFRGPKFGDWYQATEVGLDPKNPKLLAGKEGTGGIWVNGAKGRANDLYTKAKFGDVDVHLEFMVGKGSNSGIKFHGHYEVQIFDSFGKAAEKLDGTDCGGVYPRAENKNGYRHIDHGVPPKTNACKAPGEWQTLDITFLAPRFDKEGKDGKKTTNARLPKVTLNGQVVQDDTELKTPTGDRWKNAEMAEGPLMLQGDHGPVAFRNVKVQVHEKK